MTHSPQKKAEILQDRFGLKTAAYLSAGAADLPYDISERLRAARVQALARRKIVQLETAASAVNAGGSAALNWGSDDGLTWWSRIGSLVPLLALAVGFLAIHSIS